MTVFADMSQPDNLAFNSTVSSWGSRLDQNLMSRTNIYIHSPHHLTMVQQSLFHVILKNK